MTLPAELTMGVSIMRNDVEDALERLEIDPAKCTPDVIYREACKVAVNHWLISSEEMRLRCAIGVLLVTLVKHKRHEDKARVDRELLAVNALSAATQGVPVDFSRVIDEDDANDWVGLVRIWQEVRRDARA